MGNMFPPIFYSLLSFIPKKKTFAVPAGKGDRNKGVCA